MMPAPTISADSGCFVSFPGDEVIDVGLRPLSTVDGFREVVAGLRLGMTRRCPRGFCFGSSSMRDAHRHRPLDLFWELTNLIGGCPTVVRPVPSEQGPRRPPPAEHVTSPLLR